MSLVMGNFSFVRIASAIRRSLGSEKFCLEKLLMQVSGAIDNAWSLAYCLQMYCDYIKFYAVSFASRRYTWCDRRWGPDNLPSSVQNRTGTKRLPCQYQIYVSELKRKHLVFGFIYYKYLPLLHHFFSIYLVKCCEGLTRERTFVVYNTL